MTTRAPRLEPTRAPRLESTRAQRFEPVGPSANAEVLREKRDDSRASLISDLVRDARELVRAEFSLAKLELAEELKLARRALIGVGAGIAAIQCGLFVLLVALVLALDGRPGIAVALGALVTLSGGALLAFSVRNLLCPRLRRTRRRLGEDARTLME